MWPKLFAVERRKENLRWCPS
uniref:Uncharacterized protein n=1 Tax=Anguilla anguilla TaxID=7936 RepID=A0A0E9Q886_ANGAN